MSNPDHPQNDDTNDTSVSSSSRDASKASDNRRGARTRRLWAAYTAVMDQVRVEDVENHEKLHWLLSKLEMDDEEREELITLLQDEARTMDAGKALDKWKVAVPVVWAESAKLAELEDKDEKERERQRAEWK